MFMHSESCDSSAQKDIIKVTLFFWQIALCQEAAWQLLVLCCLNDSARLL
jgi:hypothetical protein